MTNPNNLEDLADVLTDYTNTFVHPDFLKLLSEKQRNFLTSLLYLSSIGKNTYNDESPRVVIQEILDNAKKKDLKGKEVDKQEFIK